MKKEEYHECSVEKGFCPTLEKFTQAGEGKPKGLAFFNVIDINTLQIKTLGVIYREKPKDNGILLNYCPFCGKDLRPFRADSMKKEKQ